MIANGGAGSIKPVVEGEGLTGFGNIDAGMRPRRANLCADLVGSNIESTKHLTRIS
jgi:hypothetical protein